MPIARAEIVDPEHAGLYHCVSRCVRRAFLFGVDPHSGSDFNPRRDWIQQLYRQAAGLFGIEVGFHTELSNHVHLVLRIRPDVVETGSDDEVARRWLKIAKLKRQKRRRSRRAKDKMLAVKRRTGEKKKLRGKVTLED